MNSCRKKRKNLSENVQKSNIQHNSPMLLNLGDVDKYGIFDRCLGRGTFGRVYGVNLDPVVRKMIKSRKKTNNSSQPQSNITAEKVPNKVAIKHFNHDQLNSRISFLREVSALIALHDHPNITTIIGIEILEKSHRRRRKKYQMLQFDRYIVMEYACNGTLNDLIKSAKSLNTKLKKSLIDDIVGQLLSAVEYCHSKNIWHRDIKPDNIFLTYEPSSFSSNNKHEQYRSGYRVLLGDFGLSIHARNSSGEHRRVHTGGMCTLRYRAPEILLDDKYYDESIDVWSIGIVFLELITLNEIYPEPENEQEALELIYTRITGRPSDELLYNKTAQNGMGKLGYLRRLEDELRRKKCGGKQTSNRFVEQKMDVEWVDDDHLQPIVGHLHDDPFATQLLGNVGIELLSKMLSGNPSDRPSCSECLHEMNYFNNSPSHSTTLQQHGTTTLLNNNSDRLVSNLNFFSLFCDQLENRWMVVDFLINIGSAYELLDKTIHLAISIIDQYILEKSYCHLFDDNKCRRRGCGSNTCNDDVDVELEKYQKMLDKNDGLVWLVGLSSLYLASMHIELCPPNTIWLANLVDFQIGPEWIERKSNEILETIQFNLNQSTWWGAIMETCREKGIKIATTTHIKEHKSVKFGSNTNSDDDDYELFSRMCLMADICSVMLQPLSINGIKLGKKKIAETIANVLLSTDDGQHQKREWTREEERLIGIVNDYVSIAQKRSMKGIEEKYGTRKTLEISSIIN